jgi:hypothetical protein
VYKEGASEPSLPLPLLLDDRARDLGADFRTGILDGLLMFVFFLPTEAWCLVGGAWCPTSRRGLVSRGL